MILLHLNYGKLTFMESTSALRQSITEISSDKISFFSNRSTSSTVSIRCFSSSFVFLTLIDKTSWLYITKSNLKKIKYFRHYHLYNLTTANLNLIAFIWHRIHLHHRVLVSLFYLSSPAPVSPSLSAWARSDQPP